MSWSFIRDEFAMQEIYDNGERFYQIGMFDYVCEAIYNDGYIGYNINRAKTEIAGATGKILKDCSPYVIGGTRESVATFTNYMNWVSRIRTKHPHIQWYISIRNDGTTRIAENIMFNINGARDTFLNEIDRLLTENPWVAGIDMDIEKCGPKENGSSMEILVQKISERVHAKGKLLHYDLPPVTAPYTSIGSEDWVCYEKLNPFLDSVTIMSYDFAWRGSSPSAVSPRWWLDQIYSYVSKSIDKDKVFLGLPAYGYRWQIDHEPKLDGTNAEMYRGLSVRSSELIKWQEGIINHNPEQAYIPFASYVNDEEKCATMLLHVYDMQKYEDALLSPPATMGEFNNVKFISTYKRVQRCEFQNSIVARGAYYFDHMEGYVTPIEGVDKNGEPTYALTCRQPVIPPTFNGQDKWGLVDYNFTVDAEGTYDLVLDIAYNWFDRGNITVALDDVLYSATLPNLHYPYALTRHYQKVGTVSLSVGEHTLTLVGQYSKPLAHFFGFEICSNFISTLDKGSARFNVSPQTFIDVNNIEVKPNDFKITVETLRREPDYCYIWSDDFRTYTETPEVFDRYYTKTGGYFSFEGAIDKPSKLIQQINYVSTSFTINYQAFPDIIVNTRLTFDGEEVGILIGDNKIGFQVGRIVVYNATGTLIKSIPIENKPFDNLMIRMRGTECKIWLNTILVGTEIVSSGSSKAGLYSKNCSYECTLFEIRDAHNMYLQEAFTISTPYGRETLGRINRPNIQYDAEFNTIYIPTGKEEVDYRGQVEISKDWVYYHSNVFSANNTFPVEIEFDDMGLWFRTIYLVDNKGSSILFYNDINSYIYWFNRASFEYKFKGCSIWTVGQLNPLVYKYIDTQNT